MRYEELNCRRMQQIIQSSRFARLAAVRDGAPYVTPVCVRCRMEGYTPVFEVRADSGLPAVLTANADVVLEFEVSGRADTVEVVLVRGRAAVEQSVPPCGCGQHGWRDAFSEGKTVRNPMPDPWQSDGRVRFSAWDTPAEESCPCTRQSSCACRNRCPDCGGQMDCTCRNTCRDRCQSGGQNACGCQNGRSGDCQDSCRMRENNPRSCGETQQHHTVITVTAVEMTGRSYSLCTAQCTDYQP